MADRRRTAIVTGGTRGIGAAITARIAADGTHVAAVYRREQEPALELQRQLKGEGLSVSLHRADLRSPQACQHLVGEVTDNYGGVDYLVNNAGIQHHSRIQDTPAAVWDEVIRVDLSAVFYLTRAAIEPMLAQGFGRIVTISSVAAVMGSSWQSAYSAAKSGLLGFTRAVAREVARKGITANIVMPGITHTGLDAESDPEFFGKVAERIPMHRKGEAEEVAHAVAFFLDDRSGYVTGAVLPVDGGLSM